MRRSDAKPAPSPWYGKSPLRVGDWTVRPELNLLEHDGQTVKLEPLVMDLLVYLAGRAGEVVTAEEVMSQIWRGRIVEDSTLYKRINQLRKAFGDDAHAPSYIETVPKRGYRLIAPVSLQTPESENPFPAIGPLNRPTKPSALRTLRIRGERMLPATLLAAIALVVVVAAVETRDPGSQGVSDTRISPSSRPSVLLRPLDDVNPVDDQSSLSIGIVDELSAMLGRLSDLDVVSASDFIVDDTLSTEAVGRTLGVDMVLELRARRSGDDLRISAKLSDVQTGFQIFSRVYARKFTDIFEIQEDIASRVVGALGVQLGLGDANAYFGGGTNSLDAYYLYLRAQSAPTNEDGIKLLERAVELDPEYAAAFAQLALLTVSRIWIVVPDEMARNAEAALEYAETAVRLEPDSAAAHAILGTIYYAVNRWSEGQEEHDRAISLQPAYDVARENALLFHRAGRSTEALSLFDSAEGANSVTMPAGIRTYRAFMLIQLGRLQEVDALLPSIPEGARLDVNLLRALSGGERRDVQAAIASMTAEPASKYLYEPLLELLDNREGALDLLQAVHKSDVEWPSKWHDISRLAAYFGDAEFALRLAGDAARLGSPRRYALWMPFMAEARRLPEFKQLVTDINLVTYWREYGWGDFCRPSGETDFTCR